MVRRSIQRLRRSEGHLEYVIITSLIMVCSLVAFMSMINSIKQVAGELRICIDCDDPTAPDNDAFATADVDGDGVLTTGEWPPEAPAAHGNVDGDGDGGVTMDEVTAWRSSNDGESPLTKHTQTETGTGTETGGGGPGGGSNGTPTTVASASGPGWLMDMFSWFSGSRWFWEGIGVV